MRTAKISINGAEHLLCLSARVVRACTQRYGGISGIDEALSGSDISRAMDEAIWLIGTMMDAGARYAKLSGLENPAPLSVEELYDVCGVDDFAALYSKIAETVTNGKSVSVEAVPPKNAEATPGEQ